MKKFYFLEYFYIVLESIRKQPDFRQAFEHFKSLKHQYRLGESKYKKLSDTAEPTAKALLRYDYTFRQVIAELVDYKLLEESAPDAYRLTKTGHSLLDVYSALDPTKFNTKLFHLMESQHGAFRFLVDFAYRKNPSRQGLLVFPNYSPRLLQCDIRTSGDLRAYMDALASRLNQDLIDHDCGSVDSTVLTADLACKLQEGGLMSPDLSTPFDGEKFDKIIKRIRDFWTKTLLEHYGYPESPSSFEIWTYRAKRIGILHVTEIFPSFHGRIVYPTSILATKTRSRDFNPICDYSDGKRLYLHVPQWGLLRDRFVRAIHHAYMRLRKTYHNYYVNIAALREYVCFELRISEATFGHFLGEAYRLNLAKGLKIRISLEVDKLPEETNLTYLKREPVLVDGRYRNIIAIDMA
ncbi:MAG: hypothetical protein WC655_15315 [Candidatus Hydrogenedentales bacterium]